LVFIIGGDGRPTDLAVQSNFALEGGGIDLEAAQGRDGRVVVRSSTAPFPRWRPTTAAIRPMSPWFCSRAMNLFTVEDILIPVNSSLTRPSASLSSYHLALLARRSPSPARSRPSAAHDSRRRSGSRGPPHHHRESKKRSFQPFLTLPLPVHFPRPNAQHIYAAASLAAPARRQSSPARRMHAGWSLIVS